MRQPKNIKGFLLTMLADYDALKDGPEVVVFDANQVQRVRDVRAQEIDDTKRLFADYGDSTAKAKIMGKTKNESEHNGKQ